MKTSLICTVFNESETIESLIDSIASQSQLSSEVIIVDGGSNDQTLDILDNLVEYKRTKLNLKVFTKRGNRSVGRNYAIEKSTNEIILITDAGGILDRRWIREITKPLDDKNIDVVAGYYKGIAENTFQKCLIPYVLVMEDVVDPNTFLPATRSMAIRKTVWSKMGKFDESLSHNEDYAFARKLKENGVKIAFAKNAIAKWFPRTNLKQSFVMFYRFALGDIEAKILRPKVIMLFSRYYVAFSILVFSLYYQSIFALLLLLSLFLIYLILSILKNYRYVNNLLAFIYLPVLQILSDVAVLSGSIFGIYKLISKRYN